MKDYEIPVREVLHFLGWHGTPIERELLDQIASICMQIRACITPRVVLRRFAIGSKGQLVGTNFSPEGDDVHTMLEPCDEVVLFAATLGAESERLLIREQARSAQNALLYDAALSAAIEVVCDSEEASLRAELRMAGLYLTDRFSPGYGDMPLHQTKSVCEVLDAGRKIGLTVSGSGVMIPRKSVTAVMGISRAPVPLRPKGCSVCSAKAHCSLRRDRAEPMRQTEK